MTKDTLSRTAKISALLVTILLGFYLLLVAIITTSHIENQNYSVSEIVNVNSLDSSLNNIYQNNDIQYPANTTSNDSLIGLINQYESGSLSFIVQRRLDADAVAGANKKVDSLVNYIKALDTKKIALKAYCQNLNNRLLQSKSTAKTNFLGNGLSYQEKYNYYQQVATIFDKNLFNIQTWVTKNTDVIEDEEDKVNATIGTLIPILSGFNQYLSKDSSGNKSTYTQKAAELSKNLAALNASIAPLPRPGFLFYTMPAASNNGSEWGDVGYMAAWLIHADSPDLTLIIGMLGFGLFGATISLFITKDKATPLEDIASNSFEIIIKGFSAAIIIFLATKGGLTIINSGTNKPNPYVLFLGCLLGSVFSQPIWDWGSNYMKNLYNPDKDDTAPKTDTTDTDKQA